MAGANVRTVRLFFFGDRDFGNCFDEPKKRAGQPAEGGAQQMDRSGARGQVRCDPGNHREEKEPAHDDEEPEPAFEAIELAAVTEDNARGDGKYDKVKPRDENDVQFADAITR